MITVPSASTIQALVEAPSVTKPSRSTSQASKAPALRAACLARRLGRSCTVLMSQPPPAHIGLGQTAMPFSAASSSPNISAGAWS